ncbi:MAG: alkaline phosphatase D family protein [Robiginitalea sp.]
MIRMLFITAILLIQVACKPVQPSVAPGIATQEGDFRIAFGSCNKTSLKNPFWDDILALGPDLWIWGGDNIYADTDNMEEMGELYKAQKQVPGYQRLASRVAVIGTWDDHDYGLNDGGVEFAVKAESQQAFLDFMGVSRDSPRRQQEGVYTSHTYVRPGGKVKIIVLDTRYFRTSMKKDPSGEKRYIPNDYGKGTILGASQWSWLERELADSDADFNILVSSIQVLSGSHGFETWGNFPHEVQRLFGTIEESGAKGVFILSGDRHISEFSDQDLEALPYALVDFTSSGLTHAYDGFKGEPNPHRVGEVVARESFGYVVLDFDSGKVKFQMLGDGNQILQELSRQY